MRKCTIPHIAKMKRVTVANNTQIGTKIKSSPMIALIARAALPINNSPTIIRANAPIVLSDFLILAKNSSKSSLIFVFLLFGFVEIATNPCNGAFEQFFDFNFSADGGDYAVSRRLTDIDVVLFGFGEEFGRQADVGTGRHCYNPHVLRSQSPASPMRASVA